MGRIEERSQRLDRLQTAVQSWAEKTREQLNLKVSRSKRLLRGRTGGDRLASRAADDVVERLAEETDDFLTG